MATKVTPDYTQMNLFQKLQTARVMFLNNGVKKSGKNMNLQFMYFELADIVPVAENIFAEVGLLAVPTFNTDFASMMVYDCDHPETQPIAFSAPFAQMQPIMSNSGKQVTNEMQALGSSITYMRRYLWQLVLDIIEADDIDANLGNKTTEAKPAEVVVAKNATPKKPATPAERKEIKQELTAPEAQADELQITALKAALKKLLELDESQNEFVQQVALKTESFTKVSKKTCEGLINGVGEMIAGYGVEAE